MTNTEKTTLFSITVAERRRLVHVLGTLTSDGWDHSALCEGWRVREVVAHLTMPYRYSNGAVIRGILSAHGSFNRFVDRAAKRDAATMTTDDMLQCLADNVESTWRPPGGGQADTLRENVIHGLDITEALGLEPPPVATILQVLEHTGPRSLKTFVDTLDGHRLEATDAEWHVGEGDPLRLRAKDILLAMSGRATLPSATAS
ncbi:MAG: maleylpyruvate isomerase family mycothiol-dependent enzyme [Propionibacteriaceae bacterium]|nr:maleylpyruvate isomerase family mycothiol-dependent enzyme [Propionibacteriaceae bacterium]